MTTRSSSDCASTIHTEMIIRRFAGAMILGSLVLALTVHIGWLGLAAFVGLNLFQSSFTGFCPLEKMLNARRKPADASLSAQG
jgi:hypothetical protein